MSDRLPEITHLQFAVLSHLQLGHVRGRDLRRELARRGVRRTLAAFYQMMGRLEEAGLVEGWYDQKVIDGQLIKERCYRITPAGKKACARAYAFYSALGARAFNRA